MDIEEIISRSGGALEISEKSAETEHPVTVDAVRKWRDNGIRDYHWPLIIKLSGVDVGAILEANQSQNPSIAPDSPLFEGSSAI